jgi:hypothetical protein
LVAQIRDFLPEPCDHRLEVYCMTELVSPHRYASNFNADTLVAQATEHFDHFDDPDLKCMYAF